MQESRMMAEVVPPGRCAIEKVSGSRMATPLAPPSPGSTPMMMPSTTPISISIRLNGDSATPKPWMSELISSTSRPSREPEGGFERPFRQGDLEPDLEDQEEGDAHPDGERGDFQPGILSELAHEVADENRRSDVEAEIHDERHVHDRRNEHGQDHLELIALDERLAGERGIAQRLHDHAGARKADQQADIEGEIARLRAVLSPARAEAVGIEGHQCAAQEDHGRGDELDRAD